MQAVPLQANPVPPQQSLVCAQAAPAALQGTLHVPLLHSYPAQHWPVCEHTAFGGRHTPSLLMMFTLTGMFMLSAVPLSFPTALSVICEL